MLNIFRKKQEPTVCSHEIAMTTPGKLQYHHGVVSVDSDLIAYNSKIYLSKFIGVFFCKHCGIKLDKNGIPKSVDETGQESKNSL